MSESKRTEYDLEQLKAPVGGDGGCGAYLRYDAVYDQIREARKEDDPNLSQGIWQTDIKRADWPLIETLCTTTLSKKTKDLQVAAWLTEAWVSLDGFHGLSRGLDLLFQLSQAYWGNIYPLPEDEDSDNRSFIFEWIDDEVNRRVMLLPIAEPSNDHSDIKFCLADWVSAVNLDKISKRSPDPRRMVNSALSRGGVNLELFRQILNLSSYTFMDNVLQSVVDVKEKLNELRTLMQGNITSGNVPNFTNLRRTVEDIERIARTALATKTPPKEPTEGEEASDMAGDVESILAPEVLPEGADASNSGNGGGSSGGGGATIIAERSDAYQAIRELANFLMALDPHSPVPQLMLLVGEWENMSLGEILKDIANRPPESQMLLRLMASATEEIIRQKSPEPTAPPSQPGGSNSGNGMIGGGTMGPGFTPPQAA